MSTTMNNDNYAVENSNEKERLVYGTAAVTAGPCFEAVSKAKERERISGNLVFYPFCEEDGTFRALQCGKIVESGTQTCWCVTGEGRLFADSIDGTRERTTEQCLDYRAREFETNEIDEPTELCVVSAKVYSAGERFTVECQTCTCVGKNEITCSPSVECSQENDKQYRVTVYTAEKKTSWIDAYYDCQ
eukprot:sb/3471225/